MKYVSEGTIKSVFAAFDHPDVARHRVAASELVKRKQRPEALMLLRVARASEADAALAAELAGQLDEALATCGIKPDPESSGRINLEKLAERLEQGDLAHKLRALELLIWFPLPQAFGLLGPRLAAEAEPWVRAAIVTVLGETGGPDSRAALRQLASGEGRAAACARFALDRMMPGKSVEIDVADFGTVTCPMCQAAVGLSRKTMGDLVSCPKCGMGFRLTLELGSAGEAPRLATEAVTSGEILPPGPRVHALFEILGELGRGGQGAVYRVRPKDGKKEFALKYLDTAVQPSANTLLANQDIASLLDHPNIVSVYATGIEEPGKRTYAVYEIVEGRSLSAILKEGPLPVDRACDIIFQVLAGLAHSHAQGVVHRDLKPDNILVTHGGVAKIADFGIGILVGETEKLAEANQPFVGTPGYAAPEQITGWGAVRASDVYAIGMTFYEMVTGRLPFPAPTLEVLLHNQVNTPPRPPSTYAEGLPPAIEAVILQCLEKSPVKRPAWAGDLTEKLKAAARGAGIEVPLATSVASPEPRRLDSRAGLQAAAPALLAGGLVYGAPLAAVFTPAVALIASQFAVFLALWVGGMAWLVRHARALSGLRAPPSLTAQLGLDQTGSARGAGLAIPFIVIFPVLIRCLVESPEERLGSLPVYIPILTLASMFFVVPTWLAWIERELADPAEAHLERGLSVLRLDGPRGLSCQVDGGPASRLPCRVLVKDGLHRIAVSGEGASSRFTLMVDRPALLSTRLGIAGQTVLDQEGQLEVVEQGVVSSTLASPMGAAVAAMMVVAALVAALAKAAAHALGS